MPAWSGTNTYAIGQIVTDPTDHTQYASLQNGNLNHQPSLNVGTWWESVITASKAEGFAVLSPQLQASKTEGFVVMTPQLQVSKEEGFAVVTPQLQVSKMAAYAVLFPAPKGSRVNVFRSSPLV